MISLTFSDWDFYYCVHDDDDDELILMMMMMMMMILHMYFNFRLLLIEECRVFALISLTVLINIFNCVDVDDDDDDFA